MRSAAVFCYSFDMFILYFSSIFGDGTIIYDLFFSNLFSTVRHFGVARERTAGNSVPKSIAAFFEPFKRISTFNKC